MIWRSRRKLFVLLQGFSLRRRVAFSLALVRLILVPVIFLAVYYLFAMGRIVDRIVNVDAPVATSAERISIDMLDARRSETNYFLLHDPDDIARNRESLRQLQLSVETCRKLQPEEKSTFDDLEMEITFYRVSFDHAVGPGRKQAASHSKLAGSCANLPEGGGRRSGAFDRETRARLIDMLRARIESFDAEVAAKVEESDPEIRQTSRDLGTASQRIINLSTALETRSWQRVQRDHQRARALLVRAEIVGGIVSLITLLVSIWVSFTLPRQVVKPLTDLKQAVDHAAAGNYEIKFDVRGEGEVVELADSVRHLIAHLREKHNGGDPG